MADDGWGNENSAAIDADDEESREGSRGRGQGGDNECRKCGEEGHFAKDCPQRTAGDNKCRNCGEEGHIAAECPEPQKCRRCKSEDHQVSECPQRTAGDNKCRNCREEGHIAAECPEPQRCRRCKSEDHQMSECPEPAKCGNCREEGHMTSECPLPEVCRRCRQEGHKVVDCTQPVRCARCGQEGHMARDCSEELATRSFTDIEGNVKEIYVPKENFTGDELFKLNIQTGINFGKYADIPVKVTGEKAPAKISNFKSSGLSSLLLENISKSDYTVPTPVQGSAIPIIKAGRDLMACAQTGSGKTAAFLLPVIDKLLVEQTPSNALADLTSREPVKPEVVIVTPTRELARQIHRQAKKFALGSGLRAVVAYGETSVYHQIEECRKGCNILVATPGRLLHFAEGNVISFVNIKALVLDEADKMLEEGFMENVQKMVTISDMPAAGQRQTLMFSATFSDEVQLSAQEFLSDSYLFLTVGSVEVGMAGGICQDIELNFFQVEASDKREQLDTILESMNKENLEKTIIFVGKKTSADYLAAYLSGENMSTTSIHGDRTQRQREEALADFTDGKYRILVATAVAARGLDIPQVQHVINYDLPDSSDEFIHRIGRTARVGNVGKATSFFCSETDFKLAPGLVKVLAAGEREVPDYIAAAAETEAGSAAGGGAAGNAGGDDEWV